MNQYPLKLGWLLPLSLSLVACSGLLPTKQNNTQIPWQTFDEAKTAFEQIKPNQTTLSQLKDTGFDPDKTPNIKIINYLDVIQYFMANPSIRKADLDPHLAVCLDLRELCYAYEMQPEDIHSKRYGNAFMDLLNFRRKTKISGWRFKALIVMNQEVVAYKLWSGEPQVLEHEDKRNPLVQYKY
jgi:hypothetical protein